MQESLKKKVRKEICDSIPAASVHMGIPREQISKAKALGCPAFRYGRIYVQELREWLENNAELVGVGDLAEDESRKLKRLQGDYLETKIREAQKNLVSMQVLEDFIPKCLATAIEIAQRHMEPTKYNAFARELRRGFEKILAPPVDG
jgi:hypothetical protein